MQLYKINGDKVYVHCRDWAEHELVEHTRTNVAMYNTQDFNACFPIEILRHGNSDMHVMRK